MAVPDSVLLNLKCENCECYLSCGPVLMLDEERSRCGRCEEPEGEAKRNKKYEELAKWLKFPCCYKENGCEEKFLFGENKVHEKRCAYRIHKCPIDKSGKCDWSGLHGDILEHCKLKHPNNVIENSAEFNWTSFGNYVLFVSELLFLVQTGQSTDGKKLYFSVQLFGDPKLATKYTYDIDIKNKYWKITRYANVAPEGCVAQQDNTFATLYINILAAVIGTFQDAIFSLTVRSIDGEAEKKVANVKQTKRKNNTDNPTTLKKSKESVVLVNKLPISKLIAPVLISSPIQSDQLWK